MKTDHQAAQKNDKTPPNDGLTHVNRSVRTCSTDEQAARPRSRRDVPPKRRTRLTSCEQDSARCLEWLLAVASGAAPFASAVLSRQQSLCQWLMPALQAKQGASSP